MQTIILGLGKDRDNAVNIIDNIINRGYEKYKKDDIPLVITLGDENTVISDRTVDINQSMEFGSWANSRFGNINVNRTLGSDSFAISDTFINTKDLDSLCCEFSIEQDKKELFAKRVYDVESLDAYTNKSIKLYKSVIINYCDKYKKSLSMALSRALGYTIAKDLTLGKYVISEDDNITEYNPLACRTAIMIIASYYSWQILDDTGASYKIRNIPELNKSAKMAIQMFILGGLSQKDIDNGAATRYLYLICNYITLNYVTTGNKINVRTMFSEGSSDYEKLATSIRNSVLREGRGYSEAIELTYKKKLEIALPTLEKIVNVCIDLVEKCKVSQKLVNADIEPVDEIVNETINQLTKTFDDGEFNTLRRKISNYDTNEDGDNTKSISEDTRKKFVALARMLPTVKNNIPVSVLSSQLLRNIKNNSSE